jgi:ribosomal RNA-processing protein 12
MLLLCRRRWRAAAVCAAAADDEDDEEGGEGSEQDGGAPPAAYTPEVARQAAEALRSFSRNWLPLLFKVFLDTAPESRAHIGAAISAYCTITDQALLANLFR